VDAALGEGLDQQIALYRRRRRVGLSQAAADGASASRFDPGPVARQRWCKDDSVMRSDLVLNHTPSLQNRQGVATPRLDGSIPSPLRGENAAQRPFRRHKPRTLHLAGSGEKSPRWRYVGGWTVARQSRIPRPIIAACRSFAVGSVGGDAIGTPFWEFWEPLTRAWE
jgi:hypothetical protein